MASKYNLIDYDPEEERDKDPNGAPLDNLISAADYMRDLLCTHGVKFAVMGGFAMLCHGSSRTTRDIDIVVDASMSRLWQLLEPEPR
ncbi:predicted protein [Uncinocarpus reesii 1704]|uniref:Uncharacterized protein n=1 Tax=Uncinocarpus reesii (strain UAMH 1704) TaxID=336963 RepID=C4JNJ7_UNCRE|nr:uncharacterized protein UREG_02995 [Uncinocarpus reesii 1704]EEP78150.1 predicted protein [Uncinocarpus reesii 1704]